MTQALQQYRRALNLARTYYLKAFTYFAIASVILLALALLNATVPVLLREATNRLAAGDAMSIILITAAAYALCWTGAQVLEWLANLAAQDPTAMTVSVTQSTRDGSERRTIGGRFTDDGEYVGGYALRGFELKVARRTSVFNPQMSEHPISLTEYRAIEVGYDVHPESVRIFGKVSLPEIGTGTVSEALTPLLDALVSVVEYLR